MNAEELKEAIIKLLESNLEYYSTGWESFETLNRESKESVITGIEGLVDEYANQSKWISVEDSLPETDINVLIAVKDCRNGNYSTFVGYIDSHLNTWSLICSDGLIDNYEKRNEHDLITHWQPLPTFNEK